MKKLILLMQLIAVAAAYPSVSHADGHGGRHHRHHHRHYHDEGYYPQQESRHYSPPPQDPRSHQGLAGGVVGSVLGYEMGRGDPVVTGLGAAAGSYLGNGIAGRR